MSRPALPTEVLDARGSFLQNPDRKRTAEPKDDRPIGSAPKRLLPEQVEVWNELVEDALPGVLKRSDRAAFEMLVRLITYMRAGESLKAADRTLMVSLFGQFGMTPAARSKIVVTEAPNNTLSSFLKRQPVVDQRRPTNTNF